MFSKVSPPIVRTGECPPAASKRQMTTPDPDSYVTQNKDELVRIIKHSQNEFPRALALAALVEYGDASSPDKLLREIEDLEEEE